MMIKHLRDLLRAFLKEHASAKIKLHKSKLLIYDEYLKKYVSAEELLIPGETKKGQKDSAAVLLSKSKEFILFDLLLKKFINPKLDLLTPGINNVNPLTNICDFRIKHDDTITSSTDYFWGKKKGSNKHNIPALPPVHDTKHEIQEPSPSKVGWAGQVTKKPVSDPRPEHSDISCSIGPGKDPNKKKAPKKKECNKKLTVCRKVKQDQGTPLEATDSGANEGDSEIKKTSFLKENRFQEEDCFPLSKDEGKYTSQKSAHTTDENVKNLSITKEKKNVFKKICCQLFSSGKPVEKTSHKEKVCKDNDNSRDVKSQSYKPNESCKNSETNPPTTKNIKNDCCNASENDSKSYKTNCENEDDKALPKRHQNTCSSTCSENKPPVHPVNKNNDSCKSKVTKKNVKKENSLKRVTSKGNHDSCNKKVCTPNAEDKTSVKKCISASKDQTQQHKPTQCSKVLSSTQCCDLLKEIKKDNENVKTEKDFVEGKSVRCHDDLDIDQMKTECKKVLALRQTSTCKQSDSQSTSNLESTRKKTTSEKECSTLNMKYNFMVCPKANFQKPWNKDLTPVNQQNSNDTLINKTCKASTRVINKSEPKEKKSVCDKININNDCKCQGEDSVRKTVKDKNSTNKDSFVKCEKKTSSTKKTVKGSFSLPNLNCKKQNKEENIKYKCSRLKETSKKGLEFGLSVPSKAETKSTTTSNIVERTTKCKTVQIEPQKNKKCTVVDTNRSSKSQCQHIEPQVTEKLQRIAQGKCFEEVNLPTDLSNLKSDTYMGFKIKKSCSETKQDKKTSFTNKCSNSKLNEKQQIITADFTKDSGEKCTTPKIKQKNLNISKSDQCMKKEKKHSSKETCGKNKTELKSKRKTNISTDKEIKNNNSLCSNKLRKEMRGKSVQRECQAKRIRDNSEKSSKTVCSQPPDEEIVSRNKASKVNVDKSKHTMTDKVIIEDKKSVSNNTNCENLDSKEKCINQCEEPCDIKEEECLSNSLKEEQSLCKESSCQCETVEDAVDKDAIKNNDMKDERSKNVEQCEPSQSELENKLQADVDTCKETNIGRETETTTTLCSTSNQDLGDKPLKCAVLGTENKKAKKTKTKKRAKSKECLTKKNKLHKSKSSESSKKPWKRSNSKQSKKSVGAAICKRDKSNKNLKQSNSEKQQKNRSKDARLETMHKTKSSPDLPNNLKSNKSLKNLKSNKVHSKEINETKCVTEVKKSSICSQSSLSIKSEQKQKKSKKALSTKKSGNIIKKSDSQKSLKDKERDKLCSLHTLQKRVTENPVKQSKRFEIKSFSELKSVSYPELNMLALKAATNGFSKTKKHLSNFNSNNQEEENLNFAIMSEKQLNTANYNIYNAKVQDSVLNLKDRKEKEWNTKPISNSKDENLFSQDRLTSKPSVSALSSMYKEYHGPDQPSQEKAVHNIKKEGETKVKNIFTIKSSVTDKDGESTFRKKHAQTDNISSDIFGSKKENIPTQDKREIFAECTNKGHGNEKHKAGTIIKGTNRSFLDKNKTTAETKAAQQKLPKYHTTEEQPNLTEMFKSKSNNFQRNLKTHDSNRMVTKQPTNTTECNTEAKYEDEKNKSLILSSNSQDVTSNLNSNVIFQSKTATTQKQMIKRTSISQNKSNIESNQLSELERADGEKKQRENMLEKTMTFNSSLSKPMSGLFQKPKYTKEENVQRNVDIKEKTPVAIDLKQISDIKKAQPSSELFQQFGNQRRGSCSVKLSTKPRVKIAQTREARKPSSAIESNSNYNNLINLKKEDEKIYVKNTNTRQTKPESMLVRRKSPKIKKTPSKPVLENSKVEQKSTTLDIFHNKYERTQGEKVYKTIETTKGPVKVSSLNSVPMTSNRNLKKFTKTKTLADELDSNTNKIKNNILNNNPHEKNSNKYLSTFQANNTLYVESTDQNNQSIISNIKKQMISKNNENETTAKATPEIIERTDFDKLNVKNKLEENLDRNEPRTWNLKAIKKSSDKRLKKIARKDPILKNMKKKKIVDVTDNESNIIKNSNLMKEPNTKERNSDLTLKTKGTKSAAIKSKTYVVKHLTKTSVTKESEVSKKIQSETKNKNQLKAKAQINSVSIENEKVDVLPGQIASNNESFLIEPTSPHKTTDKIKRKWSSKDQVKAIQVSLNNDESNKGKVKKQLKTIVNSPVIQSAKLHNNTKTLKQSLMPKPGSSDQINKEKVKNVLRPSKSRRSNSLQVKNTWPLEKK